MNRVASILVLQVLVVLISIFNISVISGLSSKAGDTGKDLTWDQRLVIDADRMIVRYYLQQRCLFIQFSVVNLNLSAPEINPKLSAL